MAGATDGVQASPAGVPRGAWRAEIDLRIRELRYRLLAAEATLRAEAKDDNAGAPQAGQTVVKQALAEKVPPQAPTGEHGEADEHAETDAHAETDVQAETDVHAETDGQATHEGDGAGQGGRGGQAAQPAQSLAQPSPTVHHLEAKTSSGLITVEVSDLPARMPTAAPPEVRETRVEAVKAAIKHASEAILVGTLPKRIANWWTGAAITAGWESVHGAEAELVDIESEADVRASLPHLATWLQQVMPTGEPRKRYEGELTEYMNAAKTLDRTIVRQVYKDVVRSNNESKANLRAFRNLLIVLTAALATVLVAIAVWHAIDPGFVSLCGTGGSGTSATACLSGKQSRGHDVLEVELLGALGGLLSLVVAFTASGTETPPSRYNVRPAQAALKVVAGAATGLVGVLIVQSGIIVSPASQTSSEVLFLVYAVVFGFSQQLLTKFVDKRAESLLGESEEKEKKGSASSAAAKA
jgi:hypothetical protein